MGQCGISVFVVAGTRLLRETLTRLLSKKSDISVAGADCLSPATLSSIQETATEVLLVDSISGLASNCAFVRQLREAIPPLKTVMIGMEEDEEVFLRCVQAGALGYVLREASANDVVNTVRAVARGDAVCPPRLCLTLFREIAHQPIFHTLRIRVELGLTRREQQLVPFIARRLTNKEIAAELNLSEQTVKNHIHRMMRKVGAEDRLSVVEHCMATTGSEIPS